MLKTFSFQTTIFSPKNRQFPKQNIIILLWHLHFSVQMSNLAIQLWCVTFICPNFNYFHSASFWYIIDLYWTDIRRQFGCKHAHPYPGCGKRVYICSKHALFSSVTTKKSNFESFTHIRSLHIFTVLMLFHRVKRVKKFINHVIYRSLAHTQFSSHIHQDDFQDVRVFFQIDYICL